MKRISKDIGWWGKPVYFALSLLRVFHQQHERLLVNTNNDVGYEVGNHGIDPLPDIAAGRGSVRRYGLLI